MPQPDLSRRQLLAGLAAAAASTTSAHALPASPRSTAPALVVAQLFDTSMAQQDVAKDFVIGSRAAWQTAAAAGGLRGRPLQHLTLEVDGTEASLRAALAQVRDNPACVVLSGTAGDPAAVALARLLRQENLRIAHVAPWLQNGSVEIDEQTFPIFAPRQDQIAHALRSLQTSGVQELGTVYATATEQQLYAEDVQKAAAALSMKLQSYTGGADLVALGQRLTPATPAVLLFVGGTPELVQFTQGLQKQGRQRWVIALADVNLQTMMAMGGARHTPVIATQAVPMVNASLAVVRAFRESLGRFFDESPTPLALAGFIAARYTLQVLNDIQGTVTRDAALAAFRKRESLDVGGFRVAFDARRRGGVFVTQSMLTADGRVVG